MNAPPHEPPLVFKYSLVDQLRFTFFAWICAAFSIHSLIWVIYNHQTITKIVVRLIIIVFGALFGWAGIHVFFRRLGCSVEIRDGKLRAINRDGTVRVEGKVADIMELKSLYMKPGDKPMEFQVVFADRRSLRLEAQVERCEELRRVLEQRTGKAFVLVPRK